jgi:N-acylneuraminate cytidylyltransferase
MQWTLENLISSELFDAVYVSTDDEEIASIASQAGAKVPFLRDPDLADDFTGTDSVVLDLLSKIGALGSASPSALCVAYPAAVGMTPRHLSQSLEILLRGTLDLVFSGLRYPSPIERAWEVDDEGLARMSDVSFQLTRTQDLKDRFYDAGQIYWWGPGLADKLLRGEPSRVGIFEVSRFEAVDIDNPEDWELAEALFGLRNPSAREPG